MALAIVWLLQSLRSGRVKSGKGLGALFIFCSWMLATAFWSQSPSTSAGVGFSYLMSLVFYLIVLDLISERKDAKTLIFCYLIGVAILASTAIFNIASLNTYAELSNRYSAAGTDPNNFGMMLVLALPLFFIISMDATKAWRILIYLALAVFAFLVISTASRAATVSMMFVFFCALLISAGKQAKIGFVLLAFAFFAAASYFLVDFIPPEAYERLVLGLNAVGEDDRFLIWKVLLDAREISFVGVGAGLTFENLGVQAHNTFLSALYEGGLLGFGFWLFFWVVHAMYLYFAWKRDRGVVSMYLIASYVVLLVAACTLNWEFRKPLYLMMAIYFGWYRALIFERKNLLSNDGRVAESIGVSSSRSAL